MVIQLAMDLPDDPLSVPLCRRALRTILRELGVDEMRAYEIELALGEAAANVIRHAYQQAGNQYRVELEIAADTVRLSVTDHGRGFDRSSLSLPEDDEVGGRGILLIEQIADAAWVEAPETGGTRITAEFKFETRLPAASSGSKPRGAAGGTNGSLTPNGRGIVVAPQYAEDARLSAAAFSRPAIRYPPPTAPPA